MRITRVLTGDEYTALGDKAVADGYWRDDVRIFGPGTVWETPWYFDPTGERERQGKHVLIPLADRGKPGFLSPHYWRDWSKKRPPLCVVCPNGELWEVDRFSSNGDGWIVYGDPLRMTCSPSIVVQGYHGFLRDGEFTPDLEGRGPNGITRPFSPSPRDWR